MSIWQPLMLVASQVVLLVLPFHQTFIATDQSKEMTPQGCRGMKYEAPPG